MKTLEEVRLNYKSESFLFRAVEQLFPFIEIDELEVWGVALKEGVSITHEVIPFTRDNVLRFLEHDVEYGFDKALDNKGVSSSMMFSRVSLWNWILNEGLENFEGYAQYGLPLFKATAIKYGFNNPIGDDSGSEYYYASY